MANVKISELPVATSLNGADSFPVVQGGVTKQAARSVLFASPTFTGTTTADILTATGDVSFDGGAFVFNDSGADKDARFEGDTDANLLFLDASTDRLGIGTSSPGTKLEVTGDITQTWAASMDRFVGSKFSTTYELGLHFLESSRETRIVSKAADSADKISFYTGVTPTEKMRLDTSGNLGIGTTTPGANLQVGAPASGSQVIALAYSAISAATIDFRANGSAFGAGWIQHDAASGAMRFATSGTERMRLDASGNLIYQVNGTAPTLFTNSTMSFELTSNTSLKIVVRGTDGVTRSVSLTLS